jgi:uncharacterized membrane protein YgdD (TMEM256/DUF423 family)
MRDFRVFLTIGAVLAGLAVAAGAFASHALSGKLSARMLEIFETGAQYQMYHALALILVALLMAAREEIPTRLTAASICFLVGIALFSGSLYALSLTGIKWLGAITPLGGAAFLAGWGCLALAAWQFK